MLTPPSQAAPTKPKLYVETRAVDVNWDTGAPEVNHSTGVCPPISLATLPLARALVNGGASKPGTDRVRSDEVFLESLGE